ncbi:MAG: hypothetical protein Q9M91_04245 [Candidatus Dojkabacteria bacterium]|nr:hypothetical protein [Candidatus Dojkabacteria bacterium]MDQ7021024.1 hypothetical protein [Candidatus Dojkabacteria bacterium]
MIIGVGILYIYFDKDTVCEEVERVEIPLLSELPNEVNIKINEGESLYYEVDLDSDSSVKYSLIIYSDKASVQDNVILWQKPPTGEYVISVEASTSEDLDLFKINLTVKEASSNNKTEEGITEEAIPGPLVDPVPVKLPEQQAEVIEEPVVVTDNCTPELTRSYWESKYPGTIWYTANTSITPTMISTTGAAGGCHVKIDTPEGCLFSGWKVNSNTVSLANSTKTAVSSACPGVTIVE